MSAAMCALALSLILSAAGCMWQSDFSDVETVFTPAGDETVTSADGRFLAGYIVEGNGTLDSVRGGVYMCGVVRTHNLTLVMDEVSILFGGTVEYAEGEGEGTTYWGIRSVRMTVNGSVSAWGSWRYDDDEHPIDVNLTYTSSVVLNFTPALPVLPTFLGETYAETTCEYSFTVNGSGEAVIYGESRNPFVSSAGSYQFVIRISREGDRVMAPNYILGTAYIPLRAVLFNLTSPRDLLRETLRTVEWHVNGRAVQVDLGSDPVYLGLRPVGRPVSPGEVEKFLYDMEDYGSWSIPVEMQLLIWIAALLFSALSVREILTRVRFSRP